MKKIISTLILANALALSLTALAAEPPTTAPTIDTMDLLNNVTNWLFAILLITAAIWIIIAGYNFITAGGDSEKTNTARNFVLYALIGVLVGFAAKGLVVLVSKIAGV